MRTVTALELTTHDSVAVVAAFERKYDTRGGDTPNLILHIIDNAVQWETEALGSSRSSLYANTLTILQSSGMGKSRAVVEASRRRFALRFNLHGAAGERSSKSSYHASELRYHQGWSTFCSPSQARHGSSSIPHRPKDLRR